MVWDLSWFKLFCNSHYEVDLCRSIRISWDKIMYRCINLCVNNFRFLFCELRVVLNDKCYTCLVIVSFLVYTLFLILKFRLQIILVICLNSSQSLGLYKFEWLVNLVLEHLTAWIVVWCYRLSFNRLWIPYHGCFWLTLPAIDSTFSIVMSFKCYCSFLPWLLLRNQLLSVRPHTSVSILSSMWWDVNTLILFWTLRNVNKSFLFSKEQKNPKSL